MNSTEIKDIENLIHLEDGQKVLNYTTKRLTAPGENYGSLMLSVTILVENPDGKQEEIHAVAKMIPPNDFVQEMFNTQVTFLNEITFYKNIVPILQNFQREHGVKEVIDFSPKFLGGRINLTGTSTVDADAVLLLENMNISGYRTFDRTEGFDLDAAELILKDLAYLHAVPLALKLQKPEVFEKEIKPYLADFKPPTDGPGIKNMIEETIASIESCRPYTGKIMKIFNGLHNSPAREPFATISHNDVWVNNTMLKVDGGKPIKNKLVDFQVCNYGSPAKDVLFFLFSSLKNHVFEQYYDDLIKFYHTTFISVLKELKCDISPFSFDDFLKEIECEAEPKLAHVLFMTFPIFAEKGTVKDVSEFKLEQMTELEPTELQKAKMACLIKEFARRNWN